VELKALQGAFNAKNTPAELKMHVEDLGVYEVDHERGWLSRFHASPGCGRGNYFRVIYTAGFTEVPEDIQEAAAEWVAALHWQSKSDPAVRAGSPSAHVLHLIQPYVKRMFP
jgi:hypothetical protein